MPMTVSGRAWQGRNEGVGVQVQRLMRPSTDRGALLHALACAGSGLTASLLPPRSSGLCPAANGRPLSGAAIEPKQEELGGRRRALAAQRIPHTVCRHAHGWWPPMLKRCTNLRPAGGARAVNAQQPTPISCPFQLLPAASPVPGLAGGLLMSVTGGMMLASTLQQARCCRPPGAACIQVQAPLRAARPPLPAPLCRPWACRRARSSSCACAWAAGRGGGCAPSLQQHLSSTLAYLA